MYMEDPFWYDDITILLNRTRLLDFVPTSSMSATEKLNAITRAAVYVGILLTLVYNSSSPIYIPLIVGAIVYIIHSNYPQDLVQSGSGSGEQLPNKNNPFMNVLLTDHPERPPAADHDLPQIKQQVNQHFSHGLYRDANDIWDKNNSQRQFYTNPSTTVPNDRDSFMKWCWKTPNTCKDGNPSRCMRFEDVRGSGL
jgi:hypothetical protein